MPFDLLLSFLISAFVTMVIVLDPIGLAPTFVAVTHGLPRDARRQVAVRASIIAAAVLAGAALIGDKLLATLGISLAAFRIAGGLLLFSIASEMVSGSAFSANQRPRNRRWKSACAIWRLSRSRSR